jgi:prepilin-type N-terminal cleavage/methylation domain-containing protein
LKILALSRDFLAYIMEVIFMKKGFTLIELMISIALYSIILVMISSTFLAIGRLGSIISDNSNSKNSILILESILRKELYKAETINISDDYVLLFIDDDRFEFNNNKLLKNNKEVYYNEDVISIQFVPVNENFISIYIKYNLNESNRVLRIDKMIT